MIDISLSPYRVGVGSPDGRWGARPTAWPTAWTTATTRVVGVDGLRPQRRRVERGRPSTIYNMDAVRRPGSPTTTSVVLRV